MEQETNTRTDPVSDPIFQRLVQPLDDTCRQQLSISLMSSAGNRKVLTWNCTHLCDKERYELCRKMEITPQVTEYSFESRDHAALFICSQQLRRHDLKSDFRKYLIGQKFRYEENIEIKKTGDKEYAKSRFAIEVGKRLNIAGGTVLKYYIYASAVDAIYDRSPELALRILLGQTKVSHENTIEISRLPEDEICSIARAAIEQNMDRLTFADIRNEVNWSHIKRRGQISRSEKAEIKRTTQKPPAIRQMPEYDPDAEVNSLCMTIGFWISSMKRVCENTDLAKITTKARRQLISELTLLGQCVSSLQASVIERSPNEE